jgi:hypothetical protein
MFVFKSRALELVVAFAAFAATPVLAQGPASACPPYYDPASGPYVHTNFPTVWQPATLLANDSAGQAMWNKIAGSIPNIAPKGQVNGSTINVTYNTAADSDCCESFSSTCHVHPCIVSAHYRYPTSQRESASHRFFVFSNRVHSHSLYNPEGLGNTHRRG